MNEYVKQQKFVNDLTSAISEFLPTIMMPQSSWTFYLKPIYLAPYEFTLTYLTNMPNVLESQDQIFGTEIISPEESSPVNLPYLTTDETALLKLFGIEKALTLHPSQNSEISSILAGNCSNLPSSDEIQEISGLFELSLAKAGFEDKYPFIVFSQSNGQLIEILGKCAGHRLTGAIMPKKCLISLGVADFSNELVIKHLKKLEIKTNSHIGMLPMLSRYYENITRDLYDRNVNEEEIEVIRENYSVEQDVEFEANSLLSLVMKMKTLKEQKRFYETQFFKRDKFGNLYLNTAYVNQPIEEKLIDVEESEPISLLMSRYVRYFPSLKYGQVSANLGLSETVEDAWNVFLHLPEIAKEHGTAVESIVVHELCFSPILESDFLNQKNKMTVKMTQKYVNAKESGQLSAIDKIEYINRQQLLEIVCENQNLSLHFNEIPECNALQAIQCTTHFGTAAIHSFPESQLDMDEAMIWAFNGIYQQCDSTLVREFKNATQTITQLQESKQNEIQIEKLKHYIINPNIDMDLFDYEQIEEYQMMQECPPCCCLCRCGEAFLTMNASEAIYFAKDIISELKFEELRLKCFDARNHSIIYQKLVQINTIRDCLQKEYFESYIPYTADQVLKIYAEFNQNDVCFDDMMKQFFFEQLIYQIVEYGQKNDYKAVTTEFIQSFVTFTQQQNNELGYSHKQLPFATNMTSALIRNIKIDDAPLLYPFDNEFILILIFLFQHEIEERMEFKNLEDSLKQLIQLNYKTLFQQDQLFFETELSLSYFVKFCSYLALEWNYIRILRQLNRIEPIKGNLEVITDFGYQEAQYYYLNNQLETDHDYDITEINMLSLLFENIHFTSDYYEISLEQAKLLLTAVTPFGSEEREVFKRKMNFKFDSWELVLNSISPGEINNLPHRFYCQMYGGSIKKNVFTPSFKDMVACSMVETVPFRTFQK